MIQSSARNLLRMYSGVLLSLVAWLLFCSGSVSYAQELRLQELIDEAMAKSPEILSSEARVSSIRYRIPQATSLPDPMVMFGYQNEGWKEITFGEMPDSQFMFSASQMIPFPGKLALKGEMATRDWEAGGGTHENLRLKIRERIKALYYDLFLAHKSLDLLADRAALFSSLEDAAVSRYSSGMGSQQEILMAQTEKYMVMERQEMLNQKVQSLEAMLNNAVGRDVNSPLGRPVEPPQAGLDYTLEELTRMAYAHSPELRAREKMIAAAEAKVKMAEKEFYPDFTVAGNVMKKGGPFEDMWSLTVAFNVPLYQKNKQRQAVFEAEASLAEAKHELEAARLMLASAIRDNYAMVKTSEKLMELYESGLIPKAGQDVQASISGYATGKMEIGTVVSRLKTLIDAEQLYWNQYAERSKAVARFETMAGIDGTAGGAK